MMIKPIPQFCVFQCGKTQAITLFRGHHLFTLLFVSLLLIKTDCFLLIAGLIKPFHQLIKFFTGI